MHTGLSHDEDGRSEVVEPERGSLEIVHGYDERPKRLLDTHHTVKGESPHFVHVRPDNWIQHATQPDGYGTEQEEETRAMVLNLQVRDIASSCADDERLQDSKAQRQIYAHSKPPAMGLGGYQPVGTNRGVEAGEGGEE